MSINILMPALSPTMTEGKLAKWHVKEGDAVKSGQVICEIETDKATMEVEAVDEGKLGRIVVRRRHRGREGQCRHRRPAGGGRDGSAQGRSGAAPPAPAAAKPQPAAAPAAAPAPAAPKPAPAAAPGAAARSGIGRRRRIFASPLAKRIARTRASTCRASRAADRTAASSKPTSKPPSRARAAAAASSRSGASRGAAGRRAAGVRGAGRHARAAHLDAQGHRAAHARVQADGAALLPDGRSRDRCAAGGAPGDQRGGREEGQPRSRSTTW